MSDERADPVGEPAAAPATGPAPLLASETFGWVEPHHPTRRELRPHTSRLGLASFALSALGLMVSWFGPWGAALGAVGLVLGALALLLRRGTRTPPAWGIALGLVSIAFSASWLLWILPHLAA
ncbi:hypothetical protein [Microbacterium excoecariae]|uniref:hypothetical protein n=1 Tax=Microbacterium excoecariae TaxID=2715210 RepID=UPI00140BCE33|nr:hypothetical protein [Microbacterium excoecariae]NHI17653.1 hypothetical protein [Microbacterium excoecariae]